jgi:hypothetical protein
MKSNVLTCLKPSCFYFDSIKRADAISLYKSLLRDEGFNYYAFSSPLGTHVRGMPKDFINEAIKLFPDSDSLYKSIKEAFRTYYGAGVKVIFTDYSEADLLDAIDLNLKCSTRWAVINEKGEYKIEPLDLYPLFKKSLS